MKKYLINSFSSKEAYVSFINYAVTHSDYFSLVYFRYSEKDRVKKSIKEIHNKLQKHKVCVKRGGRWPEVIVSPENKHVYKVVLYKSDTDVIPILSVVNSLQEWEFPQYPEELCFYRDGICWITTVHLYTDNNNEINYLSELGIELTKLGSTDDLFSINDLGKPATEEEIRVIKEKVLRYVEEQTGIEPNN